MKHFFCSSRDKCKNDNALSRKIVLEVGYVGEPLIPNPLAHKRLRQLLAHKNVLVHAHDKDLLVVRPVEDAYPPPLGQTLDIAQQKVVGEVFL